jgi:FMN hydrolase / 5-amino-6-(5-phospho-D-ribitylamino)uracil phosphatase
MPLLHLSNRPEHGAQGHAMRPICQGICFMIFHDLPLAITLDLDDTLWPIAPTIERAETRLQHWLQAHAPATARAFDRQAMRALREQVALDHPEWAHDLGALRHRTLVRALQQSGGDVRLADPAFEVFLEARQQVVFYDDVLPALHRLAQRYPLWALTNGNADLARVGLLGLFQGCISARGLGVAKPDVRIFHAASHAAGVAPEQVLHVGDDMVLDVHGAHQAGMQAVWLRRASHGGGGGAVPEGPRGHHTCSDLLQLADALGA